MASAVQFHEIDYEFSQIDHQPSARSSLTLLFRASKDIVLAIQHLWIKTNANTQKYESSDHEELGRYVHRA